MKALAFIDLLGFSNMVSSDEIKAHMVLNDFYNIVYDIIENYEYVEGHLFSDSILAHSNREADLVNAIVEIYRKCLKANDNYDTNDLSKYFLLPRGGISYGGMDIQDRLERPNLRKNFIISPALVHSAKMEAKIKGSRLLIADKEEGELQRFNQNDRIDTLLKENPSFTFWQRYKYYDCLWFSDLRKNNLERKAEIVNLINIAIKLLQQNSSNINAIEQHANTLRIGILSYTEFIQSNDPLLEQVIDEFRDSKYWLIWLTIFEAIAKKDEDTSVINQNPKIVRFYKEITLEKSWAKVIDFINNDKNIYIKELLNRFL